MRRMGKFILLDILYSSPFDMSILPPAPVGFTWVSAGAWAYISDRMWVCFDRAGTLYAGSTRDGETYAIDPDDYSTFTTTLLAKWRLLDGI